MDDPHPKALDPILLCCDPLVAAEHAQRELVDAGLQHGAELLLEVRGLILQLVIQADFALCAHVQAAVRVCRVVVIVGLDQSEESPGNVASLLGLWRGGARRSRPLGAAPPSGEA